MGAAGWCYASVHHAAVGLLGPWPPVASACHRPAKRIGRNEWPLPCSRWAMALGARATERGACKRAPDSPVQQTQRLAPKKAGVTVMVRPTRLMAVLSSLLLLVSTIGAPPILAVASAAAAPPPTAVG